MTTHSRIITGVLSALAIAGTAAPALADTTPNINGAPSGTGTVTMTKKEQYAHTSNPAAYYNIYTENGGAYYDTLRLTERNHVYEPRFTVLSASAPGRWVYPNIGQGAERGMRPYKTWNPVRVTRDGDPYASVDTALKWRGNWNATFDIWTEPSADKYGNNQSSGGTEIEIWTAAARGGRALTHSTSGARARPAYIDGKWWNVTDGWTSLNGNHWRRIYFAAQQPVQQFSGALNPFIGSASRYGMLSKSDYLTGIDYGFEIYDHGGEGLGVNGYKLTGVK